MNFVSQKATEILGQNGFEAFVVGGFVRNMIMDMPPSDIDICTNALPHETIEVFKNFRTVETGLKHGTVTVMIDGIPAEITTYRIDGEYINHRKPEEVTFTPSLHEDLKRRDFTMNAIAYSFSSGFYDPFDGKSDIEKKIIRCVGDAGRRFSEDALRILRALRFSAVLGFEIENKTKEAIFSSYPLLSDISKERITAEFLKLICGDYSHKVLKEYSEVFKFLSGYDTSAVAEEIGNSEKNGVIRLSYLENTDFLRLPLKTENQIKFIKENLSSDLNDKKDILLLLNKGGEENTVLLFKRLKICRDLLDEIISSGKAYKTDMLCISGNDVSAMGFSGKEIGNILRTVLGKIIEGQLENEKTQVSDFIKKYF